MSKLVFKFNMTVEVEDMEITNESFEAYMNNEESKKTIQELKDEIIKLVTEDNEGVVAKITNFKISFKE